MDVQVDRGSHGDCMAVTGKVVVAGELVADEHQQTQEVEPRVMAAFLEVSEGAALYLFH